MILGPGKIFAFLFSIVAILVALTLVSRFQMSMRMQRTSGAFNVDPSGKSKAIDSNPGKIGTSKASTANVGVSYHYEVNGKPYNGTRLSLNGNSFSSTKNAEEIIAGLSKSWAVSVWYDPKHPEYSVIIEPTVDKNEWAVLTFIIFLAWMSYVFLDRAVVRLQDIANKRKEREI